MRFYITKPEDKGEETASLPEFAKEEIDNPSAGALALGFTWFKTEVDISIKTGVRKVYGTAQKT